MIRPPQHVALLLILLFSTMAGAATSKHDDIEIEYLISQILQSDCVFTRNGVDYTGKEAVTHIQRKQDYFEEQIDSTERFIELAATKSEMSGRYYTVTCEGEQQRLGDWLLHRLQALRNTNTR